MSGVPPMGTYRDHPRSRGVYGSMIRSGRPVRGSSPLARGLRPAQRPGRHRPVDHPRSRGVYQGAPVPGFPSAGSSPLARGLPVDDGLGRGHEGIIPARAGFTRGITASSRRMKDHPRSRGVYGIAHLSAADAQGSSPLARGLRLPDAARAHDHGIIPARAGFTSPASYPCTRNRDHPRSRGVYRRGLRRHDRRPGSSPLARGLRYAAAAVLAARGIIPARAGFTEPSSIPP